MRRIILVLLNVALLKRDPKSTIDSAIRFYREGLVLAALELVDELKQTIAWFTAAFES